MKFAELNKENKLYFVIGLAGAVVVIIMAILGIRATVRTGPIKAELTNLVDKIQRAEQVNSRGRKISDDYSRTAKLIQNQFTKIPPDQNYYSWATEIVYSISRASGLEVDSIVELSKRGRNKKNVKNKDITLDSYTLRIVAHGDYENTKNFIFGIEQDYPLIRISGLEMSTGRAPENNDIQFFVQWPFNLNGIVEIWDDIGVDLDVAEVVVQETGDIAEERTLQDQDEPKAVLEDVVAENPFLANILEELKAESARADEASTAKDISLGALLEDIKNEQ